MSRVDQPQLFILTEEHLLLLADLYICWNDYAYDGAPGPGMKRPFGNSDWEHDVHSALGWEWPDEDDPEWDAKYEDSDWDAVYEKACERAKVIYLETEFAMAIVLQNIGMSREELLGEWCKPVYFNRTWEKVQ